MNNYNYKTQGADVSEETMIKEETKLKIADKIKVAKVIADMLGVEKFEGMSPDQAVEAGLRKVKSKKMTPEFLRVIEKMIKLAHSVGIKCDPSLYPPELKHLGSVTEAKINDIMRFSDYKKSKDMNELGVEPVPVVSDNGEGKVGKSLHTDHSSQVRKMKIKYMTEAGEYMWKIEGGSGKGKGFGDKSTSVDDHLSAMKYHSTEYQKAMKEKRDADARHHGMKYHKHKDQIEALGSRGDYLKEDLYTADFKINPETGRKVRAHRINFKNSSLKDKLEPEEVKEGWGAEGQKKAHAESQAKWSALKDKYKDHPEMSKHLAKLHTNNWKAEYAEPEAKKLAGIKEEVELEEGGPFSYGSKTPRKGSVAYNAMQKRKEQERKSTPTEPKDQMVGNAKVVQTEQADFMPDVLSTKKVIHGKNKDEFLKQLELLRKRGGPEYSTKVLRQARALMTKEETELLEAFGFEYDEYDLSDEELESMADSVDHEDDIIDLYDDEELAIIDDETGEHVDDLQEEVILEVLSRMERIKAKVRFKRTEAKRERKLKIALRQHSSVKKLNSRARKLAIKLMKQRLLRKDPASYTVSDKERVEKIITKKKGLVDRLAMKLVGRVRKIENQRLSHHNFTKA